MEGDDGWDVGNCWVVDDSSVFGGFVSDFHFNGGIGKVVVLERLLSSRIKKTNRVTYEKKKCPSSKR